MYSDTREFAQLDSWGEIPTMQQIELYSELFAQMSGLQMFAVTGLSLRVARF